jgi:phosphate transport system substrate-binding protein
MVTAVENEHGGIGYASLYDVVNAHSHHITIISINGSQPSVDEVKGGGYLFWNIEHLYTKGPATGLTKAFIDYMGSESATTIIENHSFVSISHISARPTE